MRIRRGIMGRMIMARLYTNWPASVPRFRV